MWEITITILPKYRHYLLDLKKKLIAEFKKDVICVCEKCDSNFVLSVATSKNIEQTKKFLKQFLSEIIIITNKEEFLRKNVVMENVSETCKSAFIKALMYFDYESDLKIVEECLNLDSNINVQAFYNFKLQVLKNKWNDLLDATSYNSIYSSNYEIFLEFLKFLIESIKPSFKEINIYFRDNIFILLDENGKKINKDNCGKIYKDEVGLVTDLIMLAPLKIKFFCQNISQDTKNLISYIFNGRVENLV